MVFLDANVPMYIVGNDAAARAAALTALHRIVADHRRMVTDAEVFQEILHRYVAIGRPEAIQPAFDMLTSAADEIYPLEFSLVEDAKSLVASYPGLSSRDAIHVAVMKIHGIAEILSFDTGFDQVPWIRRISG